jgi:hypothetical protein
VHYRRVTQIRPWIRVLKRCEHALRPAAPALPPIASPMASAPKVPIPSRTCLYTLMVNVGELCERRGGDPRFVHRATGQRFTLSGELSAQASHRCPSLDRPNNRRPPHLGSPLLAELTHGYDALSCDARIRKAEQATGAGP